MESIWKKAFAGLLAAAVMSSAFAEDEDLPEYEVEVDGAEFTLDDLLPSAGSAASSLGSPSGGGASWGDAGVGLYAQTFSGLEDDVDGGMGFSIGFGDAEEAVGLEISLALSSLLSGSNSKGGFGDNGSFAAKLHTQLPDNFAVAVGVDGIGRFGDENDATKSSMYVAGTKILNIGDYNLVTNLGFGNKSFTSDGKGIAAFGSLAFYIAPQLSLIADYTGRFLNVGVSVAPLPDYPLVMTLGVVNATQRFGGDAEVAASVGYGFDF